MGKPKALGPPPRLRQHLLRNVDAGDPRIRTEVGQRQPGPDADLKDMLARPIVRNAHRLLSPRVKDRAENDVIGAGKQPIGPDRIVQVHRSRSCGYGQGRHTKCPGSGGHCPAILVNLGVAFHRHQVILIFAPAAIR